MSWQIYIAAGWFNDKQREELDMIERICDDSDYEKVISPRRVFDCPPDADLETKRATFRVNCRHIGASSLLVCNTRDKDIGTIWEAGYAFCECVPIIYFNAELHGAFNLMLAQSGIAVCHDFDDLRDCIARTYASDTWTRPYDDEIE